MGFTPFQPLVRTNRNAQLSVQYIMDLQSPSSKKQAVYTAIARAQHFKQTSNLAHLLLSPNDSESPSPQHSPQRL